MAGTIRRGGRVAVALAAAGALTVLGCAARRPPTAKLATADNAVRQATEGEAAQYAPLELRLAREKLDKAKKANEDEEYERARRMAEEAYADAELASARSRAAKAQKKTTELRKTTEALRSQAERGAVAPPPTIVTVPQ